MDISEIKTIEMAKSMAYDQLTILEQAQRNLQALNARIVELTQLEKEQNIKYATPLGHTVMDSAELGEIETSENVVHLGVPCYDGELNKEVKEEK